MMSFDNKIFLFGGIHDITHEKNDMYKFMIYKVLLCSLKLKMDIIRIKHISL